MRALSFNGFTKIMRFRAQIKGIWTFLKSLFVNRNVVCLFDMINMLLLLFFCTLKHNFLVFLFRFWIQGRLRKILCKTGKGAESVEVTALLIQLLWEWPISHYHTHHNTSDVQAPPSRNVGKKSSVLQNIYGEWCMVFWNCLGIYILIRIHSW